MPQKGQSRSFCFALYMVYAAAFIMSAPRAIIANAATGIESTNAAEAEAATGSLTVKIRPKAARQAGARWRVDSGSWTRSGKTVRNLSTGAHRVEFNYISGWVSHGGKNVRVNPNETTSLFDKYSPFIVNSLELNYGAAMTYTQTVTLNSDCSRQPTEFMVSESSDFSDSTWEPYSPTRTVILSSGNGQKTVFFKARNSRGESTTAYESILLNETNPGITETVMLPGNVPLHLVWISPGTFSCGSPTNEQNRNPDETLHQVTLTEGFWIGKFPITQRQWLSVMGTDSIPWNGLASVSDDPNSPALNLSWYDAQSFVIALNDLAKDGDPFRLPSEAEWEYSCRASTSSAFFWGNDQSYTLIGNYAWYVGNTSDVGESFAHAVGLKLPNSWCLYDTNGNVWEWVQDWYGSYPNTSVTNPTGAASGSDRVLRGGSWSGVPWYVRSAIRGHQLPGYSDYLFGFRIAR